MGNAEWECTNFAKRWKASVKDASTSARLSRKRAKPTFVPYANAAMKRDYSFNLALREENNSMFTHSVCLSTNNGRSRVKLLFKILMKNPLLLNASFARRKPSILFNVPTATSVFMACALSYKDAPSSSPTQAKHLSPAATPRPTKIVFPLRESSS